jgi:hypothetical protein
MKRHLLQLGFSLLAIILLVPTAVNAAPQDVAVKVNVPSYYHLVIDGKLEWIHSGFDIPTIDDFNAKVPNQSPPYNWEDQGYGWTLKTKDVRMWVCANTNWKIQVNGSVATFGGTSPWAKPVTDILWQDGDPSIWNSLTTTPATVHTGSPMCQTDPDVYSVMTFTVLLHWSHDLPGTYEYNSVELTLSGN